MNFLMTIGEKSLEVDGRYEYDPDVGLDGLTDCTVIDIDTDKDITDDLTDNDWEKINTRASEIMRSDPEDY